MRREGSAAFRRSLRTGAPTPERVLWARLRRHALSGFRFRRQHSVGPYVLDFFCVQRLLAIEVDGDSHYVGDGPRRDEARDQFLATRRIRVLRFTNNEVLYELDGVIAVILEALALSRA
jgi:very-short-patch-repair endonuclease